MKNRLHLKLELESYPGVKRVDRFCKSCLSLFELCGTRPVPLIYGFMLEIANMKYRQKVSTHAQRWISRDGGWLPGSKVWLRAFGAITLLLPDGIFQKKDDHL